MKSYTLEKLSAAREAVNQDDKETALKLIDHLIERHEKMMSEVEEYHRAYERQHPKEQEDGKIQEKANSC